jgi:Fic family protein
MKAEDFQKSPSGHLVPTIQDSFAFVPNPLPPKLDLTPAFKPLERATLALGELSGVGRSLTTDPRLLIRPFSRKEAIASSRMEGTFTTLHELLNLEAGIDPSRVRADTREVRNYTNALEHGLRRIPELPISKRLIQEMHEILMKDVQSDRGAHFVPGEFKRDQNWIGGRLLQNARFVPPPPNESIECLDRFEKYVHEESDVPLLIRLAYLHYQFEAIHPFPDGNGRVGRILIPLILCEHKVLSKPLLYLSDYFEKNFAKYIDLMFEVSRSGAWLEWVLFFLEGISESARDAIQKATALQELHKQYLAMVQSARSSALLAKLVDELFNIPATTIPFAMRDLGISYNSAKNNIKKLLELGIIVAGDSDRPQWFYASKIIDIERESAIGAKL